MGMTYHESKREILSITETLVYIALFWFELMYYMNILAFDNNILQGLVTQTPDDVYN